MYDNVVFSKGCGQQEITLLRMPQLGNYEPSLPPNTRLLIVPISVQFVTRSGSIIKEKIFSNQSCVKLYISAITKRFY